jgi:hypothetical protein
MLENPDNPEGPRANAFEAERNARRIALLWPPEDLNSKTVSIPFESVLLAANPLPKVVSMMDR